MKKRTMFLWGVDFDDGSGINVSAPTFPKAIKLAIKGRNKGIKPRVTTKNIRFVRKMGDWMP